MDTNRTGITVLRILIMLRQLIIENIALIERLEIEFDPGLTILTGETGAGKSIVIDALALTLGARADNSLIRAGAERAMVAAHFILPQAHPTRLWLKEQALTGEEEDEELFLRRTLSASGRGRAFINEIPVPVTVLAQLGDGLVDIHGQHDHQSLLHPATHLEILDGFARHEALRAVTGESARIWRERRDALEEVRNRARNAEQRRDYLLHQLDELDAAAPGEGEWTRLEQRRSRLAHVVKLGEATAAALECLTGESRGEGDGANRLVSSAASEIESVARLDPALESLSEPLRSLQYELEDLADRIRHYADALESDPDELAEIEARLSLLRNLARKHRRTPDELPELIEGLRAERDGLDRLDHDEQRLVDALEETRREYDQAARRLSASRADAARRLIKETESQLRPLG
ncbi:MAG: AAA family ATPase, partial [Magnetococcales bacterium]|nr:AAA family ATPase [Magnetococcales bacterium]